MTTESKASKPRGTITFLFGDIVNSTPRLARIGADDYRELLERHRQLLRAAFDRHSGVEFGRAGDSLFVAFARAQDAMTAIRFWCALLDRYLGQARAALGPEAAEAASEAGRRMTLERAVEAALASA